MIGNGERERESGAMRKGGREEARPRASTSILVLILPKVRRSQRDLKLVPN